MRCPTCNTETQSVKSKIVRGAIFQGCPACLPSLVKGTELAAADHRKHDQRTYRSDIVQPFEKDYVRVRGVQAAREQGWDDESIRRHG